MYVGTDLGTLSDPSASHLRRPLQRLMDIAIGIAVLMAVLPVALAIGACIWLCDGAPTIFGHPRIGRHGRPFTCYKFRTMVRDADDVLARMLEADPEARREWREHRKLRDDPRILGRLGQFLRRSSLDELPQIFNVLRGDMSLVGPRPVTDAELRHYGRDVGWYLAARPGITGAWQISGRSDMSYAERVQLDVDYVKRADALLDLWILLRTPGTMLRGDGAY
jgi:lipopolysaccharide/colanic/teichoic acid biosynthesis glycosyltransferase